MFKNIFITLLIICLLSTRALAEKPEDCEENDTRPQCLFDIDEDGTVHTKDGEAEDTFSFPPIKYGFLVDLAFPDLLPHIAIEAFSWSILGENFAIDFGGTSGRAFMSLDWELIPIMKLGPMIWGGWNVPEKQFSFGAGFSIIKF